MCIIAMGPLLLFALIINIRKEEKIDKLYIHNNINILQ